MQQHQIRQPAASRVTLGRGVPPPFPPGTTRRVRLWPPLARTADATSISKPMTATALMVLAERGAVDLDRVRLPDRVMAGHPHHAGVGREQR